MPSSTPTPSLSAQTLTVLTSIQNMGVEVILYGSQGVSLYIGPFKQFGDVDLLIDSKWLSDDWQTLVAKMHEIGFELIDEHEHEFTDTKGMLVAFAASDILVRDRISKSVDEATRTFSISGLQLRTLTPEAFLKAYRFSAEDGYRKDVRNKKDSVVIGLLNNYLARAS